MTVLDVLAATGRWGYDGGGFTGGTYGYLVPYYLMAFGPSRHRA